MPRLQSQQQQPQHHHSQSKPVHSTPTKSITRASKPTKPSKLLPTIITSNKKASTTSIRPSEPDPSHQQPIRSKRRTMPRPSITPSPSKNHATLSLLSLYDLSTELYSFRCHSNSKLKSSARKPKKNSSNRHALVFPQSSDSDEVHSIILPHSTHSSRSSTPTPTKASRWTPFDSLEHPLAPATDHQRPSSPSPDPKSTRPLTMVGIPAPPPRRRRIRAKSVASIFELDKSTSSSDVPSQGVRDDWDMPTALPPQDLTWQQKKKPLTHTSLPVSHRTQNQVKPDVLKASTRSMSHHSSKEATPVRPQKSTLARTSSAGTIARSQSAIHPSRSEDESALTWQQTIIRPAQKPKSLPSFNPNHTLNPHELNSGGHKKNQAHPNGLKTPIKALSTARKVGIQSAVKTKTSSLQSAHKRRNSLSSGHTFRSQSQPDIIPIQLQSTDPLVAPESGKEVLSWKPFPSSPVANQNADLPPLRFNSFPLDGASDDQTLHRRHTKSYTHPPTTLSNRKPAQALYTNRMIPSVSTSSNIPAPIHPNMMTTPSKSRTTSDDLNLVSFEKQLTTPALRAAFMYAGPQFHNSPRPAALPAPKFSFGSA